MSKTIVLPLVIYERETWYLTIREERWLRAFEHRIQNEYLGTRGMRMGSGEDYIMRNFKVIKNSK